MNLTSRIYASTAPAIVAILVVGALSYWGQYAHAAPAYVILLACLAAPASAAIAWGNARFVARRLDQLAALNARFERTHRPGAAEFGLLGDEVDTIARAMDRLERDLETTRAEAGQLVAAASVRQQEYATLISDTTAVAANRIEDARMPVHILLNTDLGHLDENQEELLGATASALEELERQITSLRTIAEVDRGALSLLAESVRVADVLRSLQPVIRAQANKAGVRLIVDTEPGLPRAIGNSARFRDALQLAIVNDIRFAIAGSTVTVTAFADPEHVIVAIDHGATRSHVAELLLAARLMEAQGGSMSESEGRTIISLPRPANA